MASHKGQLTPHNGDEVWPRTPKFNLELPIQLSQQIPEVLPLQHVKFPTSIKTIDPARIVLFPHLPREKDSDIFFIFCEGQCMTSLPGSSSM